VAVLVDQPGDLLPVALDLGGLRHGQDGHVRQALQLALQHRVGPQAFAELQQGDVGDDAGQVDRRLDAGVAAADHRHALALEQRAIAVRAVGDAAAAVFLLAGHVHLAPARPGGEDQGLGLELAAVVEPHGVQAVVARRDQLAGTLQVHHVDLVLTHVFFERAGQFRAFGFLHRDEVLDGHGVQHLTAEALGSDAGADALARGVDRRRSAGRAATDDEHVEGTLGLELLGITRTGAGVELGEDLLDAHTALAEGFAVEVEARHRHDLPRFDLILEQRAVDGHVVDVGVEHGHQVQRLDHVRAVLAGQREVGFEAVFALERLDLLDQFWRQLRRMAADLQQREHQRGELMAHGQAGEMQVDLAVVAHQGKRWPARIVAGGVQANLVAQAVDVVQQREHFLGLGAVVQRSDDLERLGDLFQVGLQLGLEIGIEHQQHLIG